MLIRRDIGIRIGAAGITLLLACCCHQWHGSAVLFSNVIVLSRGDGGCRRCWVCVHVSWLGMRCTASDLAAASARGCDMTLSSLSKEVRLSLSLGSLLRRLATFSRC